MNDATVHVLSGFCSGVVSRTVTAPVERVKMELQCAVGKTEGVWDVVRRVQASTGVKGFFQGNFVNCVKVGPQGALWFGGTEVLKKHLPGGQGRLKSFWAGSLAGVIAQTIVFPLEPVKSRLTISPKGTYTGITDCLVKIFQQSGTRGFYKGWVPAMAGVIPYAGIDRATYDVLQSIAPPTAHAPLLCGFVSSSCACTISYPLALIRTRLQVQGMNSNLPQMYNNTYHCFTTIRHQEGVIGLWKGLGPTLAKSAPASAVGYLIYESCKKTLLMW
eukprot:TRINITY_DN11037_c0_g1_i2.p1 TRINITY_DN11037_c0_g1~~TRINITY_DN11037_c0_g1_i2.p1  ORF type:complete len:282 (+),score=5.84 TRINITY_DN11037_c0_g1_i2:25-846(+)